MLLFYGHGQEALFILYAFNLMRRHWYRGLTTIPRVGCKMQFDKYMHGLRYGQLAECANFSASSRILRPYGEFPVLRCSTSCELAFGELTFDELVFCESTHNLMHGRKECRSDERIQHLYEKIEA